MGDDCLGDEGYVAVSAPREYDELIRVAASRVLPDIDWRIIKAQFWQESRFDPRATSPAGALGIAQIMPGTWEQYGSGSPYSPQDSISAGCKYMAYLFGQWTAQRPEIDRICLTLASYNAGLGHILAAQKKAGGANDYKTIISKLQEVTGTHSAETIDYVRKILGFYCKEVTG